MLDDSIDSLSAKITTDGQLNYAITCLALELSTLKGANYAAYNAVIGVLEAAKLEFYRRHVAPYEDRKILENGDL